jgi:hypothetical protein
LGFCQEQIKDARWIAGRGEKLQQKKKLCACRTVNAIAYATVIGKIFEKKKNDKTLAFPSSYVGVLPTTIKITRHCAATSAIHAQTDSAPPKKSDSPPQDATADPERQRQLLRRRRLGRHRPTSGPLRVVVQVEAVVVSGARRAQVQTLEAVVAVAAAVPAAAVAAVGVGAVRRLPREKCR